MYIKIKTVASYDHQSLQAEHGIKSLSMIITKYLAGLGQMWPKYLPVAMCTCNTFNSPNIANYSPYELVFSRTPKLLLDLETTPAIEVFVAFKVYYMLLNKRLGNLHRLFQDFNLKRLSMINKDRSFFQKNSGDLVYVISLHTSQLRMTSSKVVITYIGP